MLISYCIFPFVFIWTNGNHLVLLSFVTYFDDLPNLLEILH